MRRTAVLISVLSLSVATATSLLALGVMLTGDPTNQPPVTNTTVLARAYAAAVEDFLSTGNKGPVAAIVDDGFVDHAASATGTGGRDDLLRTLRLTRASFTDLALSVDTIVADRDLAAVRLAFHGNRQPALFGIPLEPAPVIWHETDVLRIADGLVAERWATGGDVGLVAELGAVELTPVMPLPMFALARVTYAPGAASDGPALPGSGVLVVESGTLTLHAIADRFTLVRSAPGGSGSYKVDITAGTVVTAEAGDAIEIPARSPDARNDGDAPAVVLGVTLSPPPVGNADSPAINPPQSGGIVVESSSLWLAMAGVTGAAALPPGVEVRSIAFASASRPLTGAVTLGLGRAVLPPGAGLPAHRVPGLELFAVEAGTLQFDAAADPAAIPHPQAVTAGNSVTVQTTTAGASRGADGPLDLLIVVIAPAPDTTSAS